MRIKVWGARGSIPAPGPETMRYGGNTSCVELTLSDGSTLILDAGTGIRNLGLALGGPDQGGRDPSQPIHILLTHLHLDHIQGLMFFAPAFLPESEITIWGPASPEASLCDRIARYISAPLAPVEVRELPSHVSFREAESLEWEVGPARVSACAVNHRGPTLGYRIEDGGTSLCYIPDHEPGLGAPLQELDDDWISGFELARGASLLIHDCQYTDAEYAKHIGWGHSPVSDALCFAHRVRAERVLLFHHDPMHSDDFLDALHSEIETAWQALGGAGAGVQIELAAERGEIAFNGHTAPVVVDAAAEGAALRAGASGAPS
jgi:phosphoribosyl 1,2-cyclic phosphodiesterase